MSLDIINVTSACWMNDAHNATEMNASSRTLRATEGPNSKNEQLHPLAMSLISEVLLRVMYVVWAHITVSREDHS
jgi:hypothetical protein